MPARGRCSTAVAVDQRDVGANRGVLGDVSIEAVGELNLEFLGLQAVEQLLCLGLGASTIATTLKSRWNGIGIDGLLTAKCAVPALPAACAEEVGGAAACSIAFGVTAGIDNSHPSRRHGLRRASLPGEQRKDRKAAGKRLLNFGAGEDGRHYFSNG